MSVISRTRSTGTTAPSRIANLKQVVMN